MRVDVASTPPGDWDSYVGRHAFRSSYHRAAAVAIGARAFGLRSMFLVARSDDGGVRGVLPLVEQSSFVFGRFLVSVPFFTYGGILADDDDAASALAESAAELGRKRRVDHVELRHARPMPVVQWPERLDKVSMVLELPESEEQLSKRLGAKLRSQIRRGEREQPELVWGGAELLPEFYAVFARTMHALGTPVYSRGFFDVAYQAFGDAISVLVVRVRNDVQAAAITVRHGDALIEVPWAAATVEAKRSSVNMRMYWEMLRGAIGAGARAFDFGRSSVDSGTFRFKAQWGAEPRQLHWHYWIATGDALPQINHSNPKYALAASVWRRLPLWCANAIGPRIASRLP